MNNINKIPCPACGALVNHNTDMHIKYQEYINYLANQEKTNIADDIVFNEYPTPKGGKLSKEDKKYINSQTANVIGYPGTGFDPEKLTFNGLEIKKGDKVRIGNDCDKYEVDVDDNYIPSRKGIYVGEMQECGVWYDIQCFNIVAHYPQELALERAKKKLNNIHKQMQNEQYLNANIDDYLDRYYQARKHLEELENNN